jgi:hypothetical protein
MDFSIFQDIYNLNVKVNKDNTDYTSISWTSDNGEIGKNIGTYSYGFSLHKNGNIWKVLLVAMQ